LDAAQLLCPVWFLDKCLSLLRQSDLLGDDLTLVLVLLAFRLVRNFLLNSLLDFVKNSLERLGLS